MVKKQPLNTILVTFLALLLICMPISPAFAQTEKLFDPDNILSPEQKKDFLGQLALLEEEYNTQFFYALAEDMGGEDIEQWADDFLNKNLPADSNGIIFCCETKPDGFVYIQTRGPISDFLNDTDCNTILESALIGGLNDGDYYLGGMQYLASSGAILAQKFSTETPPAGKDPLSPTGEKTDNAPKYIFDDARLLSADEKTELRKALIDASTVKNIPIFVKTTMSADTKNFETYADMFLMDRVGKDQDGIALVIAVNSRDMHITCSGKAIDYLTDKRQDELFDAMIEAGISEGKYGQAFLAFTRKTQQFLKEGIPAGQTRTTRAEKTLTLIDGIIALGAGLLGGGGFFALNKRSYKGRPKNPGFDLQSNAVVNLQQNLDSFVDSSITSRTISKPKSGSNTSTTHTTGGGTFGGSGRKF